jgi:hypothetical protein
MARHLSTLRKGGLAAVGLGWTLAYNTIMGYSPATFRLRVAQEFWAENRLKGTAFMLSFGLPLSMKMPAPEAARQ